MTQKLTLNLADILERRYPSGFHVPADIDLGTFLEFADDDWDHCLDLDAHLEAEDSVALVWSVSDVLARRPDLTTEQAWTVLVTARDDFRRGECHLDFIEATANGVFPVGPLAKEASINYAVFFPGASAKSLRFPGISTGLRRRTRRIHWTLPKELLCRRVKSLLTAAENLPDSGLNNDPGGFSRLASRLEDLEKAITAKGDEP
ncbi:MAG: hypothetical protein K2X82_09310 [Gemmataceae bacterium]|nr:hypothetical protein [Gemmataceae bacterium]